MKHSKSVIFGGGIHHHHHHHDEEDGHKHDHDDHLCVNKLTAEERQKIIEEEVSRKEFGRLGHDYIAMTVQAHLIENVEHYMVVN